jgi:hypothetical protein
MFELKQRTDNPVNTVPVRPDTICRISVCSSARAGNEPLKPLDEMRTFALHLAPELIDDAPIFHYLRHWFDGRYSRQCLHRMLTTTIDAEEWHALCGVEEFRQIHSANIVLIEALLSALDEREESRAA